MVNSSSFHSLYICLTEVTVEASIAPGLSMLAELLRQRGLSWDEKSKLIGVEDFRNGPVAGRTQ
jgi:hypothetical protein